MKRFMHVTALLIGGGLMVACASLVSYKAIHYFDADNNLNVMKMEVNKIGQQRGLEEDVVKDERLKPPDQVYVNLLVSRDQQANERYQAEVILRRYIDHSWGRVKSEDYLLIKPGVSLCLTVDGDPIFLVADKPSRPDLTADNPNQEQTRELIEETAIYKMSREHVERMAKAKKIVMTLKGEHGEVSAEWSAWNIRNVRLYWDVVNQSMGN